MNNIIEDIALIESPVGFLAAIFNLLNNDEMCESDEVENE